MDVVCCSLLNLKYYTFLAICSGAILLCRRLEKRFSPCWCWSLTPDTEWMWYGFGAILLSRQLEKCSSSCWCVANNNAAQIWFLVWGGWRGERWHGNKHLRHDDAWQRDNIPHLCVVFWGVILFLSPTIIPNGQKMLYYYLVKFIICGTSIVIVWVPIWSFVLFYHEIFYLIESISIYVILHLMGSYT